MRDPGTNAKVEAAIAEAVGLLTSAPPPAPAPDVDVNVPVKIVVTGRFCPDEQTRWQSAIQLDRMMSGGDRVLPARKVGHPVGTNASRDALISALVDYINVRYEFAPTRNAATRDCESAESACSIVQKALARLGTTLGERTIERIWKKNRRRP